MITGIEAYDKMIAQKKRIVRNDTVNEESVRMKLVKAVQNVKIKQSTEYNPSVSS